MKIVFLGSAHFAQVSLARLAKTEHAIACVVTQQDKKQDRGMCVRPTPVKEFALENGLPVYQPADINSPEAAARLKGYGADVFVVIAYGQKLSQQLLDMPAVMPVNIHASLLPYYRGAAPINRALINGETVTGVTAMKMVHRMDAGPVILQKECAITPQDTAETLERSLAQLGADLLVEALDLLAAGKAVLFEQDEAKATHAAKLKKADGLIDWSLPAKQVIDRVRGCQPWPGAFTYYKGKLLKIFALHRSSSVAGGAMPGEVAAVSKHELLVKCADGLLALDRVQAEGGTSMPVTEFIAGHKVCAGEKFLLH